jgi:peptidoglycan/LPS O-acetylase OafA/YrhL
MLAAMAVAERSTSLKRYAYLDSLRGLAILGVLAVHASQHSPKDAYLGGYVQTILSQGARGVELFFMVSAFTLFLTLSKRVEKERHLVSNFFIRRYLRIAPFYYIAIGYFLLEDGFGARYWLGDHTRISPWNIAANVGFVHDFNPYWMTSLVPGGWSIGVEMTFYLFVPLLFFRLKTINHALLFLVASVAASNAWTYLLEHHRQITDAGLWNNFITLSFPTQVPFFALGIVLYFALFKGERNVSPTIWAVLCVFVLMGATIGPTGRQTIYYVSPEVEVGLGLVLLFVALESGRVRLLNNRFTAYIGRISYSMYFVHFAILHWMGVLGILDYISVSNRHTAIANYAIRLLVLTGVSAIISTATFKVVELPFQNLAQRLVLRHEARDDPPSANLQGLVAAETG